MEELLTSKEIENIYLNKQVLSDTFKETLGKEQITLVINTITYSYNWINVNMYNCKNITYLGKESGLIKLTTNHNLKYKHPMLIIYTTTSYWNPDSEVTLYDGSNTTMPKIHLGSWMDSIDRKQDWQLSDPNGTWATAWPLTSVIPWINSSYENKIRIGIDTALEYRTQRQIGNILKYYAKYGKYNNNIDINNIFITTKIPCANTDASVKAGNGVIIPSLQKPKEYAINLIILNLLELGWINAKNILNHLQYLDWSANPTNDVIVKKYLKPLSKTISRMGNGERGHPIDLLLLHHTPKDRNTYKEIFTGFELAKQAGLIKNYGFSNVSKNNIDKIINDLSNNNPKINPVVIQQQSNRSIGYTITEYNITNQWVMTHCDPEFSNNYCAKYCYKNEEGIINCQGSSNWINNSNTIIHSLNMNPALCKQYASSDTTLPNATPPPSSSYLSSNLVYYITGDPNDKKSLDCSSININDVYLGENSYYTSYNKAKNAIENKKCNLNMNRENPCNGGTCWPGTNNYGGYNKYRYGIDSYGNIGNSGICVYGDARPITYTTSSNEDYTPYFYDDTLTKELSFNSAEDWSYNLIFQPEIIKNKQIYGLTNTPYYWIYIGLLYKPVNMVSKLNVPANAYKLYDAPSP